MPEKEEDVKEETSTSSKEVTEVKEAVDETGVPYKNRIKELERKLKEKEEMLASLEIEEEPEEKVNTAQLTKQELSRLVEDPKKYISDRYAELKFQEEIPKATAWLGSRKGYTSNDDVEIVRLIREHNLQNSFPMKRAVTSWKLLQQERSESSNVDSERVSRISSTSPEGSGRTVPLKTGPSKQELLKQLELASTKGDFGEEVRLNELLEDMSYQEMKK